MSRRGHRDSRVRLSALHIYSERWTTGISNMTESEGTGVQPYIRESNALKGGRSSTMLQSSMDRAAQPRYRTNLALRTAQTNLTSAGPTPSSAAQMLGENEDSYVHSYIQTQCTGLLARHWRRYICSRAEKMKDSVTSEGRKYSNSGLSINPRCSAFRNMTSHCGESKRQT